MRRTSSATLELPEDTLVMLYFQVLLTRNPSPACPLLVSEWYSRWPLWRVVKLSSFSRTSPSPITSHFMLSYFGSSSSSCKCSSFSNILTLYVAIFSRSPLVWWFLLTQIFLAPPVCSLGGPEPPPRSHTSMLLGTGALAYLYFACWFFHGLPFHADQCGLEGGTEIGVPSLGSCVLSTEELYLPCYLTQLLSSLCSIGWFGICVVLLLDQLPYQAVELGFGITVFLLLGQLPVKANEFGPP